MISVIIPNYNRENLIIRAVMSALNQKNVDVEVIVVDDASSDNSLNKLSEIEDKRLKVVALQKNSGACVARNKGIEVATGEYVAFLDSDDMWKDLKLENQYQYLKSNNYDVCVSAYNYIKLKNPQKPQLLPNYKVDENQIYKMLLEKNFITTGTIFAKKEVFNTVKFDVNLKRYQDWDLALQLAKKYKVGFLNQPLLDMYEQSVSITNSTSKEKKLQALEYIYSKYNKDIIKNQKSNSQFLWSMGLYQLYGKDIGNNYIERSIELEPKNFKKRLVYILIKLKMSGLIKKMYSKNH